MANLKPVALPLKQMNSVSVYVGSRKDAPAIWKRWLAAAAFNGMKVIILQREAGSALAEAALPQDALLLPCTPEGLKRLDEAILREAREQNVRRDEYCREHGIPEDATGKAIKARHHIYANSKPVLILIERMADLLEKISTAAQEEEFATLFQRNEGYNIHYAAGFYPEDMAVMQRVNVLRAYNQANFSLVFGGNLDQQRLITLPMNLRSATLAPDRCLMQYRDNLYSLRVPNGGEEEQAEQDDPDEAPIL